MRAASLRHAESVCEIRETCLHGDTHTRHTPTRPGSRPRSRAALDSSSVCTSILLSVSDMVNGRALRTDGDASLDCTAAVVWLAVDHAWTAAVPQGATLWTRNHNWIQQLNFHDQSQLTCRIEMSLHSPHSPTVTATRTRMMHESSRSTG